MIQTLFLDKEEFLHDEIKMYEVTTNYRNLTIYVRYFDYLILPKGDLYIEIVKFSKSGATAYTNLYLLTDKKDEKILSVKRSLNVFAIDVDKDYRPKYDVWNRTFWKKQFVEENYSIVIVKHTREETKMIGAFQYEDTEFVEYIRGINKDGAFITGELRTITIIPSGDKPKKIYVRFFDEYPDKVEIKPNIFSAGGRKYYIIDNEYQKKKITHIIKPKEIPMKIWEEIVTGNSGLFWDLEEGPLRVNKSNSIAILYPTDASFKELFNVYEDTENKKYEYIYPVKRPVIIRVSAAPPYDYATMHVWI